MECISDSLYAQVLDTLRAFQEEQEDFMFFEDYEDTVKGMFYGFSAEEDLEDSGMTAADREEISDTAGTASDIDNIQWYLTTPSGRARDRYTAPRGTPSWRWPSANYIR